MEWIKAMSTALGGAVVSEDDNDEEDELNGQATVNDPEGVTGGGGQHPDLTVEVALDCGRGERTTVEGSGSSEESAEVGDSQGRTGSSGEGGDLASPRALWLGGLSWLQNTKDYINEKGKQIVETVGPDLSDFAQQIKSDTHAFMVEHRLVPESDEEGGSGDGGEGSLSRRDSGKGREVRRSGSGSSVKDKYSLPPCVAIMSSHYRCKYASTRESPDTYLRDPPEISDSNPQREEKHLEIFASITGEPYEVLDWVSDEVVIKMRAELVPKFVTEDLFWKRFLFRIHMLNIEEARLRDLMARKETQPNKPDDDDEIKWDDDDDDAPPELVKCQADAPASSLPSVPHTSPPANIGKASEESESRGSEESGGKGREESAAEVREPSPRPSVLMTPSEESGEGKSTAPLTSTSLGEKGRDQPPQLVSNSPPVPSATSLSSSGGDKENVSPHSKLMMSSPTNSDAHTAATQSSSDMSGPPPSVEQQQ